MEMTNKAKRLSEKMLVLGLKSLACYGIALHMKSGGYAEGFLFFALAQLVYIARCSCATIDWLFALFVPEENDE